MRQYVTLKNASGEVEVDDIEILNKEVIDKIGDQLGEFTYQHKHLFFNTYKTYFKYNRQIFDILAKLLSNHITNNLNFDNKNGHLGGVFAMIFQDEEGKKWGIAIGKKAFIELDEDNKPIFLSRNETSDWMQQKKLHEVLLEKYIHDLETKINSAKKELMFTIDKIYSNENTLPNSSFINKNIYKLEKMGINSF